MQDELRLSAGVMTELNTTINIERLMKLLRLKYSLFLRTYYIYAVLISNDFI